MSFSDHLETQLYKTAADRFASHGTFYTLRHNESSVSYFNITGRSYVDNWDYTTPYNFTYKYTFSFENQFDAVDAVQWVYNHRWLCNIFIIAYLIVIHSLRKFMENRQRFELRSALVVWNTCLAVFSIFGCIRVATETWYVVETFGMDFLMCYTGKA